MLRFGGGGAAGAGKAGEHQIEGAQISLGQAYGGNAQYFSMAVFTDTLDRL